MVDISTVSAVVAATSVVIGVIFAVFQLRNLVKTRQSDMLMRLYLTWGSEDLQEAVTKVMTLEFKDYDEFVKKYGLWTLYGPVHIAIFRVGWFFDGIGVLLHGKLADIALVDELFGYMVIWIWETLKPMVDGTRKLLNQPRGFEWFEYLYNEIKKREQKL